MLLRYAGRAFETEDQAKEASGQLLVKGVRSMWRQSAPIVQNTLHGCLERLIMHQDISAALKFAKSEIYRLLSARVEVWELIMTGGLWRVTGQQIERGAAAGDATGMALIVRHLSPIL